MQLVTVQTIKNSIRVIASCAIVAYYMPNPEENHLKVKIYG